MAQVEQRRYARVPVALDCVLYSDGAPVDFGRTRDFSRGGVAVRGLSAPLPSNARLVIELRVDVGHTGERYRIPARVTRSFDDGVAAVFTDAEPDTIAALERRVQEHSHGERRPDA
ncbi:MAG TPA: PilZ domain-containing protein [Gammaproteobacteria bacterium]|nr:PilZ domain-containing protein [Gammaproteobacteria bacterium]